jgi:hypothetical protein
VSGPGVCTFVAPKLEVAFFESLDNEELCVVPFVFIFDKEPSEGLFTGPFNANPLYLLIAELALHHLILDRQLTVYIVFNLLNRRVTPLGFDGLGLILLLRR